MKKITFSLMGAVLIAGCSKNETDSADAPGQNPLNAPADYLGGLNQAQKSATRTVDVASLTKAIDMFQAQEDRLPTSLNELVEKRYIPVIPEPPAGSKLNYDPQTGKVTITK